MANKLIGSKGLSKSQIILGFCLIFFTIPPLVAQRTISGFVTDIDKDPLIGVTILIKDYNLGTTTDVDGNYNLEVPEGARFLVFSYIGFADRIVEIGLQDLINPTLRERTSFLDEVVVTGVPIGTPTTKVGFNISKVNTDQLKEVPGVNVASAIQGKVPGVQITSAIGLPGSSPDIRIRGGNNLFGDLSSPLIIVDGIQLPEQANLADINSEDIDNIEVIKGAAATSLYGSRAGSGVINITTKRGSNLQGKKEIVLRNEFGTSYLSNRLSKNQHHPYKFNSDGTVDFSTIDDDEISDNEYPEIFDQHSLFFDPGQFMTNSLSIGSGNEETNYFISFNNTKQDGVVFLLDGYSRQSVRANIDHKIFDFLKLSFSNYYAQSTHDEPWALGPEGPVGALSWIPASVDLLKPNEEDGSPYNYDAAIEAFSFTTNPLYDLWATRRDQTTERFSSSLGLDILLFPFLSLNGSFSLDRRSAGIEEFTDKGFLAWPPLFDGEYQRSFDKRSYRTTNLRLTFRKSLKNLTVASQAAMIYEKDESNYFGVTAFDFRFQGIRSLSNSGTSSSGSGAGINRTQVNSRDFEVKTLNYYLTGSLDWKDKIIIDGLIRYDGSSLFGSDNRWNTFYRTSLAYRLTKDIEIPKVQELKLRASYGTAGNRPKFDYRFETLNSDGTKNTLGNENIRSSIKKELEVGLDALIWDRINLNFTYARSRTSELFYNIPLPAASGGFRSQWQNIDSEIQAISWEASVGGDLIRKRDFDLSVDIVFDRLLQKVIKFDFPDYNFFIYHIKAGEEYGALRMAKFARSAEDLFPHQLENKSYVVNELGWLVDSDKLGTVDERPVLVLDKDGNDQFVIGTSNPDFNLGFNIKAKWKRFQIYSFFHWKQGGNIYNNAKARLFQTLVHGDVDQSDKPLNQRKPLGFFREFNSFRPNNYFLEDGSYLKLREVALSYNCNVSEWGTINNVIKGIKISLIGRNLWTITNYSGYDPEVGWSREGDFDSNYDVLDGFGYPNHSTITATIEVKF